MLLIRTDLSGLPRSARPAIHRFRCFDKSQAAKASIVQYLQRRNIWTPTRDVDGKKQWRSTLHMPETAFNVHHAPMKQEPIFRKRTTRDLYQVQEHVHHNERFILHDGPPYANGSIHLGHAVNKILKDIVNRYQVLNGKRVLYTPGWDCHGLPIESKTWGFKKKWKEATFNEEVDVLQLRSEAERTARFYVNEQKEGFEALSIMADWSEAHTYRTLDKDYVLRQMQVLREMVRKGLIYRARRPVYYSPLAATALAESELEYHDAWKVQSVYVRFPIRAGQKLVSAAQNNEKILQSIKNGTLNAVIWTTTPWTLPSNMAMMINPAVKYAIVRWSDGEDAWVVAEDCVAQLSQSLRGDRHDDDSLEVLLTFEGSVLLDSTYIHPYLPEGHDSRPILAASYVTATTGTGLVHSAPGHGHEDWETWQDYCKINVKAAKEEVMSPIDNFGKYTSDVRTLGSESMQGLLVQSEGVRQVINDLQRSGSLVARVAYKHRQPLDWRTKQPVIVMCTPQWFCNLESIKEKALQALQKVRFQPESGRQRLESMLNGRKEWCISRQRRWGVPIPVVYDAVTHEPLLDPENMKHIEQVLYAKNLTHWWVGAAEEFVAPQFREAGKTWYKGTDIVDVWFDSGTSWTMLPAVQKVFNSGERLVVPPHPVADLYLEGSDQHRGWFQSSLLTYIALADESADEVSAPYKEIVTHGFIVDKRGEKLSKSSGTAMDPTKYIKGVPQKIPENGVDVVRFWVGRADYRKDIAITGEGLRGAYDAFKRIRNTMRYMLGLVPKGAKGDTGHPTLQDLLLTMDLPERYVLHKLYTVERACREAYDKHEFFTVAKLVSDICTSTLSAFYFELSRDSLYCDSLDSERRQAKVAVLAEALRVLNTLIAPIVPHLAEEVHHYSQGAEADPREDEGSFGAKNKSLFRNGWQSVSEKLQDEEAEREMTMLFDFQRDVARIVEGAQQAGQLKTPLSAALDVYVPEDNTQSELALLLLKRKELLSNVFMLASVTLHVGGATIDESEQQYSHTSVHWKRFGKHEKSGITFVLSPTQNARCERCRTHWRACETKKDGHYNDVVCVRCIQAMQRDGISYE